MQDLLAGVTVLVQFLVKKGIMWESNFGTGEKDRVGGIAWSVVVGTIA